MKRAPDRPRPIDIVEVPAPRPDPRSAEPDLRSRDPAVTQKISREQLEDALRRTKSGTRRAIRSEPELPADDNDPRRERDSLPGPRDDQDNPHVGPQVTIVRIDSVEMDVLDPPTAPSATAPVLKAPGAPLAPRTRPTGATDRVHITPRAAFVAGLAVAVFVLLAAGIGFFAGRIVPGSR